VYVSGMYTSDVRATFRGKVLYSSLQFVALMLFLLCTFYWFSLLYISFIGAHTVIAAREGALQFVTVRGAHAHTVIAAREGALQFVTVRGAHAHMLLLHISYIRTDSIDEYHSYLYTAYLNPINNLYL